MNKVILMGRLTRDPEIRSTQGENPTSVANFTLAVDRRRSRDQDPQQQTADFIRCVAFGRQAEFAQKYLRQGIKMVVVGRIQTGSYTNREGQKVYTTEVMVEELEFAESKSVSDSYRASMPQSSYSSRPSQPSDAQVPSGSGAGALEDFMNIPETVDEGLPF